MAVGQVTFVEVTPQRVLPYFPVNTRRPAEGNDVGSNNRNREMLLDFFYLKQEVTVQ